MCLLHVPQYEAKSDIIHGTCDVLERQQPWEDVLTRRIVDALQGRIFFCMVLGAFVVHLMAPRCYTKRS